MFDLTVRLEALITPAEVDVPAAPAPAPDRRPLTHKLGRVKAGLDRIDAAIPTDTEESKEKADLTQLPQYYELSDYKKDLATLYE